jgi:hypothetical protein
MREDDWPVHAARKGRGKFHAYFEYGANRFLASCGGQAPKWRETTLSINDVESFPPPGVRREDCCKTCLTECEEAQARLVEGEPR